MKKFIYSLSFAMAFGVVANAATPAQSVQKLQKAELDIAPIAATVQPSMTFERLSPAPRMEKRKVQASDFEGTYSWSGRNLLVSVGFPNEGVMVIQKNEENPSRMIISGFDFYANLDCYFDEATGHLVVPNQYSFTASNYNAEAWFMNYTVQNGITPDGEPGYRPVESSKPFYFTLDADGNILAGDTNSDKWNNHEYTDAELEDVVCIAVNGMPDDTEGGYFWMCIFVKGEKAYPFEYVKDEWEIIGTSHFKDCWFPIYWENNNTPDYDVALYRNKADTNLYMLYNPYGPDTPYGMVYSDGSQINLSNKIGFLIFTLEDPECVMFKPMVYGATIDMRLDPLDPPLPTPIYCFNAEGYNRYLLGATVEDIITYWDLNGLDLSYLDKRAKEVSIYNPVFTMGENLIEYYGWNNYDGAGYIQLPDNYESGVESILGEDNDAPASYFNLQGVRLANPEKGQIVIVRKGNNAYKTVIR